MGKNGKAMENLSRTLGKLIREEKRWKEQGEGKMMPSKIEAPMWDHYRVMEKQWKNCSFDMRR